MGDAILLTGRPGCGKTTLIRKIIDQLSLPMGGFTTQEIRSEGNESTGRGRKGFEIVTLDGQRGVLAHVEVRSPVRVGKYRVNLHDLETLAVNAVINATRTGALVVIDEIGPMEIASASFRQAVLDTLASPSKILGSIVQRSTSFTDQIKRMPQVTLIEIKETNRQAMADKILGYLSV